MSLLKHRCQQSSASLLDGGRFKFTNNGSNVLAVAHVDSVTCGLKRFKKRGRKVYSTSLDDRLGVHVILDILPTMGINVDVLLTDDEEIGQSTAQEFMPDKQYNWMFQFDRRGTDCVHYEYDVMAPHIRNYFTLGRGSFSDICWLDHLGCGGMNVGTGYYNEHSRASYANLDETYAQVLRFGLFYEALKDQRIEHIPYIAPPPKKRHKAKVGAWNDFGALNQYDDADDDLAVSEYDKWARVMGYRDVDDVMECESLPGRIAALDLIDDYIFGAQGFAKDFAGDSDDDGFRDSADYAGRVLPF